MSPAVRIANPPGIHIPKTPLRISVDYWDFKIFLEGLPVVAIQNLDRIEGGHSAFFGLLILAVHAINQLR